VLRRQQVGHLLAVDGVAPLGQQVDLVALLGKQPNRRLEVAEKPEVGG
jgi:hypothetical protein